MNKTKFLEGLKEALQGEISAAELNNQLLYYEGYIDDELRKGRTEEDICNELGEPRLIARTIIETKGKKTTYENGYYKEKEVNQNKREKNHHQFQINGVLALVIGIFLVFLIIAVIFSLVSALTPILIPVALIILIISYFQKRQ